MTPEQRQPADTFQTLETTTETCSPLSSGGGRHLPQTTEQPLSALKAALPSATAHLLCVMTLPTHSTALGSSDSRQPGHTT